MKIDPKKIARMITEDPNEVVPSDHFDDFEDEYGGPRACDVCERPREEELLQCDICQDVYGLVGAEISGICSRCTTIRSENDIKALGDEWDSEINGADWYVNFNASASGEPHVVCPGCLSKRKVWQNPQANRADRRYNLYDFDGNLI